MFGARAAYVHVGALIGTIMVWNVFFRHHPRRQTPGKSPGGAPICSTFPLFIKTIRSARVKASCWSWVTYIAVCRVVRRTPRKSSPVFPARCGPGRRAARRASVGGARWSEPRQRYALRLAAGECIDVPARNPAGPPGPVLADPFWTGALDRFAICSPKAIFS